MAKLSENQQAALDGLKAHLTATGAKYADKAAWKKGVGDGVSVNTAAMVKTGRVEALTVQVSGRTVEVFAPAGE